PASSRRTRRFRSVSTARQGTPSTRIGVMPPAWPAGSRHSETHFRAPVVLDDQRVPLDERRGDEPVIALLRSDVRPLFHFAGVGEIDVPDAGAGLPGV